MKYMDVLFRAMLVALCLFTVTGFTSCNSDDEPDLVVGYYLSVQSRVKIYSRGGLPPAPKEHMIGKMTIQMKERINEVYPVRDLVGNDAAVMMACDDVYDTYKESHMQANAECVVILNRAWMSGIVVKQSKPIKTYRF